MHVEEVQEFQGTAPKIELPDGSIITASHWGYLHIPELPKAARLAHIFPDFVGRSLLAIPTLCQHGCVVTYTHNRVRITFNGKDILPGVLDPATNLWFHYLEPPTTTPAGPHSHNVITHRNDADRVRWYHAAFSSPAIPTFKRAIARGLIKIHGLNTRILEQNEPTSAAMHEGHLKRSRAGVRSTKLASPSPPSPPPPEDHCSPLDSNTDPTLTLSVIDLAAAPQHRIHLDATGRFPIPSTSGTQYYLVAYEEASNFIHVAPMPDRGNAAYDLATRDILSTFRSGGNLPPLLRVDNELSNALADSIQRRFNLTIERAPPQNHRTLRAERAIQTWKNHFIATLCTAPDHFPLTEHDRLLPYSLLTLNLMRESHTRPGISAWEHIHGPLNWPGCIFAPPGLAVLAYQPKDLRGTWGPHGQAGFFLGPQLASYRTHRVFIPSTYRERVTDTVAWLPKDFRLPGSEPTEHIAAAIADLTSALTMATTLPEGVQQPVNILTAKLVPLLHELRTVFSPDPSQISADGQSGPTLPDPPREDQRVPAPSPPIPQPSREQPIAQIRNRATHRRSRSRKPTLHPETITPPTPIPAPTPAPDPPHITHPVPISVPTSVHNPAQGMLPSRTRQPNRRYAQQVTTLIFEKGPHDALHHAFPTLNAAQQLSHPPVIPILLSATSQDRAKYVNSPSTNTTLPSFRLLCQGPDGADWIRAGDTAIHKLVEETQTMQFVPYRDKVKYCYYKPVCKLKLDADGIPRPHVRGTAADTNSTYEGPTSATTAGLSTVKILLNSVVSTPHARFCTADIKDYYLGTPMAEPAFMVISLNQLSPAIIEQYQLNDLARHNNVMVKITKGMYGLTQAGRLAQDRLIPHLAQHGYEQSHLVPMLFRHAHRPIFFTLIVDDFGIKYSNRDDAEHLFSTLREIYTITTDMTGQEYLGLSIAHDTVGHKITISIPDYVRKALDRFAPDLVLGHGATAPMRYHPFTYGPQATEALDDDTSASLSDTRKRRLQAIVGTFLYYARALDITAAYPVAKLASLPTTEHTEELAHHFLKYMASHPNAHVTFSRSNMQHNCHSDASFNNETRGRSRAAGYHFLGDYDPTSNNPPNGSIDYVTTIIDVVVASATEAELAAIFINAQLALNLRNSLVFLGHPQGPSLVVSDNLVGVNILNGTAKSKRSRSIDLRYFWIKDRISQKQFKLAWAPGSHNLADYLTKIHPAKTYESLRSKFVTDIPRP